MVVVAESRLAEVERRRPARVERLAITERYGVPTADGLPREDD